MNIERSILIAFLGNYLTNTVVAALVALVPASATPGVFTPQYISYVVLALVVVAVLTWWYMQGAGKNLRSGVIFGVIGFLVALATAFISGLAGVLTQTGSLSQMAGIVPNFWPFLASYSTLVLAIYWIVPAALMGWYLGRSSSPSPMM
ncbi:hypothetical protein A3C20_03230 [Candidatus Kaiserbacteria bacterium RIFCSPHIGHO2_02_FULL_55_25]|uniref:Uncharacterized protein n=1 Tax=Candidatus Kaiserbacteria bacterium RIFCSPHIGHO2_02_FULL_55_25 TaxID=1798498 RepID=A0A1F6E6H8_9BACT|nr:MAG: hypothetical protein A2764_02020 [Candidatus Kaiserbacteria bacterium RIFCSPHIGHO2_01_FULL_55_79]OGG69278.1 MAG: hypothetical protein A3C20_03230 [Candidatus Kaiserbacteria bacterium RIFCSPHIGHO2_02_FULL_55_25]OGG77042.1 MAG: hypothetical protein A3F56_01125 [Candidatus Kaiserbacteria bacterium RIFCSPHIGHO2_12_FULL_55_13]OGG83912.1 MAG: hypothetical protein A3A42_00235 [Candidatus Kaiserbacteria bacterium RIFCSPLOWO2_01_FULL_55_25]